ncbi:hypothetical protein NDU88_003475 [Pleurodeles waltl]|uniref:Uncharacterized protein n=1 Tax=Pleurodeles waltl TaxID=8319 RepID=A0AAV7WP65_PLEWA|nr:hypothetical protein NDU88_003475 [Pleurodeles waltl]
MIFPLRRLGRKSSVWLAPSPYSATWCCQGAALEQCFVSACYSAGSAPWTPWLRTPSLPDAGVTVQSPPAASPPERMRRALLSGTGALTCLFLGQITTTAWEELACQENPSVSRPPRGHGLLLTWCSTLSGRPRERFTRCK